MSLTTLINSGSSANSSVINSTCTLNELMISGSITNIYVVDFVECWFYKINMNCIKHNIYTVEFPNNGHVGKKRLLSVVEGYPLLGVSV